MKILMTLITILLLANTVTMANEYSDSEVIISQEENSLIVESCKDGQDCRIQEIALEDDNAEEKVAQAINENCTEKCDVVADATFPEKLNRSFKKTKHNIKMTAQFGKKIAYVLFQYMMGNKNAGIILMY